MAFANQATKSVGSAIKSFPKTKSLLTFSTVADTVSGAFDWLEKHPVAASAIGGAASAGLGYLQSRQEIKARKAEIADQRAYRSQFGGASTVDPNLYGQNLNITDPQSGIASDVGTVGAGGMEQGSQPPTMASAFDLRAQRQGF